MNHHRMGNLALTGRGVILDLAKLLKEKISDPCKFLHMLPPRLRRIALRERFNSVTYIFLRDAQTKLSHEWPQSHFGFAFKLKKCCQFISTLGVLFEAEV